MGLVSLPSGFVNFLVIYLFRSVLYAHWYGSENYVFMNHGRVHFKEVIYTCAIIGVNFSCMNYHSVKLNLVLLDFACMSVVCTTSSVCVLKPFFFPSFCLTPRQIAQTIFRI
jgi:hypothetical protein